MERIAEADVTISARGRDSTPADWARDMVSGLGGRVSKLRGERRVGGGGTDYLPSACEVGHYSDALSYQQTGYAGAHIAN